jgi:hypothetical protein
MGHSFFSLVLGSTFCLSFYFSPITEFLLWGKIINFYCLLYVVFFHIWVGSMVQNLEIIAPTTFAD